MKTMYTVCFVWIAGLAMLQAQTITQQDFLETLKQSHPIFEKEALTHRIETEDQNSLLGAEDWHLYSTATISRETPEITYSSPERTDALSAEVGIKRTFWETGGRLSASLSTSNAKIKIDPILSSMYGIPESFYQNKVALTYTHPLLKNARGFLDRLEYNLKQFDIDFSKIQALENQEDFLAGAAAKFVDWALLTEQMAIISARMKLSEEELDRTQRKRNANLVDDIDVIRAEDAVRIARQNQMLAESQWQALQSELAIITGDTSMNHKSPNYDLYAQAELPDLETVLDDLQSESRILKTLQLRLEQLHLAQRGYKETGKADLSLFAQMNTKKLNDEIMKSLKMDKYDIALGIQFSVPLENRTAKSNIDKTLLMTQQLEAQKDELALSLSAAVSNLYIQIRKMDGVLKLNREQIESAERKTEEELKHYNQGRSSLTFVILSRDSEEDARLLYAGNAAAYQQLLIQYQALMDKIL